VRGIRSEVEVGSAEGLPARSVINCDNVVTVPKSLLDQSAVGRLAPDKRAALDGALRYALGIQY
jgi:mRNA interferase MazF